MRTLLIITLILAFSLCVAAQPAPVHADANSAAESEIKALQSELAALIAKGDWDEYAKHLASDYFYAENGHVETWEEALASLRDVKRKIIVMEMEPDDLAIRIYGDTAIASAKFDETVREAGQVKSRSTRVTDVFIRRDGQWYLAAGHASTLGK